MIESSFWVALWVYVSFWLLGQILLLFRKGNEPVKSRQPIVVFLQNCVAGVHLISICVSIVLWGEGKPISCLLTHFTSAFFLPLWGYPFFLRAFNLWYEFKKSEQIFLRHEAFISGQAKSALPTRLPGILHPRSQISSLVFDLSFYLLLLVLFIPIVLAVSFTDPSLPSSSPICLGNQADVITAQGALAILLMLVASFFLMRVADAFYVKIELMVMGGCYTALYILWLVARYGGVVAFPHPFAVQIIDLVLCFLSLLVTTLLPTLFSFSFLSFSDSYDEEYRKVFSQRRVSVPESVLQAELEPSEGDADYSEAGDSAFFKFVLENEILSRSFEKFAIECRTTEALYFYRHVQMYRKTKDEGKRVEQAKRIAKEYLSPNAPFEINIPQEMKEEIINRVENGNSNPSLFHRAEVLVFIQMRLSAYPMWRNSRSFRIVLKEAGVKRPSISTDEKLQVEFDGRTLSQSIREALRKRLQNFQTSSSMFGSRASRQSKATDYEFSTVNSNVLKGSVGSNFSTDENHAKNPPRRPSIVWEKSEDDLHGQSQAQDAQTHEPNLDSIAEEPKPSELPKNPPPSGVTTEEIYSKLEKRKNKPLGFAADPRLMDPTELPNSSPDPTSPLSNPTS